MYLHLRVNVGKIQYKGKIFNLGKFLGKTTKIRTLSASSQKWIILIFSMIYREHVNEEIIGSHFIGKVLAQK